MLILRIALFPCRGGLARERALKIRLPQYGYSTTPAPHR
ncbi:hypothetical protein PF66_06350 [Pseudomonas asplenii]|uniref:Uncharacterized protein n=1 Tax=Pseudomonas asplenii TaxID=53407 RepID=A0A0N0E116_9PSED|nr:hypothetical protein PF66_06350 [Pseudomonas fuscovaginae]KPA99781.1 hypothetical protein PF70_00054 [Pseudomonas fuscovaginae]